jgi:hypothetical protein
MQKDVLDQLRQFEMDHRLRREWDHAVGAPLRISREVARRLMAVDDPVLQDLGEELRLANVNLEVRLKMAKAFDAIPVS